MKNDGGAVSPKIIGALSHDMFIIQESCVGQFEKWIKEKYGKDFLGVRSYQDGEIYAILTGGTQVSFREYLIHAMLAAREGKDE